MNSGDTVYFYSITYQRFFRTTIATIGPLFYGISKFVEVDEPYTVIYEFTASIPKSIAFRTLEEAKKAQFLSNLGYKA